MAEVGTSARSGASTGKEITPFPQERDLLGENPARFLDWDFLENEDAKQLARARIRGLEDVETCAVWKRVERELGRGEDGGARATVIDWIDERLEECIYAGKQDFDAWLDAQPKSPPTESMGGIARILRTKPDGTVEVRDKDERDKASRRDTSITRGGESA